MADTSDAPGANVADSLVATPPDSAVVSRSLWARRLKRPAELVLALCLLLLVSPALLVAIVLTAVTSPGPILFTQTRTGRHGRTFRLYKLRTMAARRAPDPQEIVGPDHPEVTPIGKVLRTLKIDELPQLINVIRGQMALVGPRPTLPVQTSGYNAFQNRRLLVRPGLTGLAQVNGNTSISWDERIKYDVYYVENHGLTMDLGIVFKTSLVIILGERRYARPFDESPYAPYRWG